LEDHEGRFPYGARYYDSTLSLLRGLYIGEKVDPNNAGRLQNVRTEGIACCPMATRGSGTVGFSKTSNGQTYVEGKEGSTFAPWEITRPAPSFRMSYGLNAYVGDPVRFDVNIFSLRGCDNIPLLLDSAMYTYLVVYEGQPPPKTEPSKGMCINRHNGHINALFFDWTVRKVGLKELWTLKWYREYDTTGPWTKAGGVQPEDWPQWMRNFKDY
jgi:prepilin-type processing-associated H-X9-DG protein